MKIVFEDIKRLAGSSFRILVNPKLNDFYYWHFHPEFELTYIVAPSGTLRIGNYVGDFKESDLVFIGSNIPHLNFDYGIKTEYEKVVLQIKEDFFKNMSIGLIIESEHIDRKINEILYEFKHTFYIYFLLPILVLTVLAFVIVTG